MKDEHIYTLNDSGMRNKRELRTSGWVKDMVNDRLKEFEDRAKKRKEEEKKKKDQDDWYLYGN